MKIAILRHYNAFGTLLDEVQVEYLSAKFDRLLDFGYRLLAVECTDNYVA